MSPNSQREYLESRVTTASGPQLHLMLIDGALRFCREAEKALMREDEELANPAILRAMKIVGEMLVGVRHSEGEINQKLGQLYLFVYSRLTSVYANGDFKLMAEAIKVLEFQQETWQQACKKVAEEAGAECEAPSEDRKPAPMPHMKPTDCPTEFSFEA